MIALGRKKYVTLVVTATVLALVSLILLSNDIRGPAYDTSTVAHTFKLPVRYNANVFSWVGPNRVAFVAYTESNIYDIRSLSIASNEVSSEYGLTSLFNSMRSKVTPMFSHWRISPDGTRIAFATMSDTRRLVTLFTLDADKVSSVDVTSLGRIYELFWFPDSYRWLLCGYPPSATTNWWLATGSNSVGNIVQPTNCCDYYPAGVTINNEVLMVDLKSAQYVNSTEAILNSVAHNTIVSVRRSIRLPFLSNIRSVAMSPDGTRIIWMLQEKSAIPFRAGLTRHFPFIQLSKNSSAPIRASLWMSDADGADFVRILNVPYEDIEHTYIEVSPDRKHIGVLVRGQFTLITIPK